MMIRNMCQGCNASLQPRKSGVAEKVGVVPTGTYGEEGYTEVYRMTVKTGVP
jgi:hypothetical protein